MLIAPVGIDLDRGDAALLAEAHDRSLAELFLDLADGQVERLEAFLQFFTFWRHGAPSSAGSSEPGTM